MKYCVTTLMNNICTLLIHIADWSLHSWLYVYVYTCIQSTAINYPSTYCTGPDMQIINHVPMEKARDKKGFGNRTENGVVYELNVTIVYIK